MNIKKIIPTAALNRALSLENVLHDCESGGADEIFLWDDRPYSQTEEEEFLASLGQVCAALDTPLMVYRIFPRFENIKKLIYAGAAKAVMNPLEGGGTDTLKEGVSRFGEENVYGTFLDYAITQRPSQEELKAAAKFSGCTHWVMTAEDYAYYAPVIRELRLFVLLAAKDFQTDEKCLETLKETPVLGLTAPHLSAADYTEFKQELKALGLETALFESALPFSSFKLGQDGLIPVIVQDYKNGKVLMLAYMNEASYEETIKSGRMTYYSRSRQCLWKKGDTSGHYQYVKSLEIDCDKDTLLAKVKQIGAACHTGSESCFFTNLVKKEYDDVNPSTILLQLMDTVLDRKAHPKEGSYTNYLFDKGLDKILKKVGEEATEIVIAAKNPDASELKYEIADFLYHMVVLMADRGVSWDEILKELAKRH